MWNNMSGEPPITRSRVQQIINAEFEKLEKALADDPLVIEWLNERRAA
jgi:hypothetical protein